MGTARKRFVNHMCDGPICSPWKHGIYVNGDSAVDPEIYFLETEVNEPIENYGWGTFWVYGKQMVLCPRCQKEMFGK